jgi:DNA-binding MarR family transcriptional regulator
MINNRINHMDTRTRKRRASPEIASKSTSGPRTYKTDQVVKLLKQPGGATVEEIATEIGWSISSITRIVQWLLFVTRSGVTEMVVKKRPDGTTVYRAA